MMLIWLLGVVTSHTSGGLIHVLPGIAIEFLVLQIIVGQASV